MKTTYQHTDTKHRGYQGISLQEQECRTLLQGSVKDNLLDREERDDTLNQLRALQTDTGFAVSGGLMADIQALESEDVQVKNFRIGEAFAEILLEKEFSCRFHWNELRDARNPKGNKTGADLVGFLELEGQTSFLFGEVKTSSETANRPPQVMTTRDGIENQLLDLGSSRSKRQILIAYLKSKTTNLPANHPFAQDFTTALKNYYSQAAQYHLAGVLVRDVASDEEDVAPSYRRLQGEITEPAGLRLVALYVPLEQKTWQGVMNENAA
ncbi:MAG TPA: hypothetical protein DCE41_15255 [Cytophagales bacterium]|nr:hypothetical protein [Cytophagales bacterium]HAA17337.1 hypothetical protein [Cytophagales bacterium]HAP63132.1 hypothetical protein [Cytophagales bacterium]